MSGKDEIARLRSIMAAAADEIEEHWEAHCDREGFGPVNLVRRLRTGKGDYRSRTQSISKCGHEANIKDSRAGGCAMNDDLARRAVACRHWRWLPGMALVRRKHGPAGGTGLRPTHLRVALTGGHPCDPFACIADVDRLPRPVPHDPHWVPDLTDPATVGALLALVREAWEGQYTVCGEAQLTPEALVAALEAAP